MHLSLPHKPLVFGIVLQKLPYQTQRNEIITYEKEFKEQAVKMAAQIGA